MDPAMWRWCDIFRFLDCCISSVEPYELRWMISVILMTLRCCWRLGSDNAPIFSARSVSARWCTRVRFRARIAARGNVTLCIIARKTSTHCLTPSCFQRGVWTALALLTVAVRTTPAAVLRPVCLSAVCVADSTSIATPPSGCTSTDTATDMAQVESGRACDCSGRSLVRDQLTEGERLVWRAERERDDRPHWHSLK